LNVQTVPFMPMQDAKALSKSVDLKENRADTEAFSKELERKVEEAGVGKDSKSPQNKILKDNKGVQSHDGQKAESRESKETDSVEKREVKDSVKKTESGEGKLTKKQATKEERLKRFMDSLESEFQIPPTRIVEAFSELTPEELSLPADQSINRVVENLNLSEEAGAEVKDLYGSLVLDLEKIDSSKLDSSSSKALNSTLGAGASFGLTQERFDKVKNQKLALQKSLDQMNQSFWQPQVMTPIQNPIAAQGDMSLKPQISNRERMGIASYRDISQAATVAEPMDFADLGMTPDSEFNFDPDTGEMIMPDPNVKSASMVNESQGPNMMAAASALAARQMMETEGGQTDAAAAGLPMMDSNYANASGLDKTKMLSNNPKASQLASKLDGLSVNPTEYSTAMLAKLNSASNSSRGSSDFFSQGEKGSDQQKSQVGAGKTNGDEMKAMMAASIGMGAEAKESASSAAPIAAPLSKVEISPEVTDRNIQNVFQQAQYLVKKGGGEMKIKMTPEGLGEIQLRVELKEGRVQLHMMAENKETKKMLETSLPDLRESLNQQKISLDSVKIDSVVRTNVENQAQGGNQFGQNQNQHQDPRETRQFWNQFQENFGGRSQRDALFEQPKPKGYAPKASNTIAPAESTSVASRSKGTSKGLNLVA
jgi:flagellar hook-length control protein FliK